MAQNFIGWEALDAQLRWVSDVATRVIVVRDYDRTDTYADVTGKMLCWHHISQAPLFGDIFDEITLSGADENAPNRVLPYLGSPTLTAVGSNPGGSDTAIVVVQDNADRILFVINERYNAEVLEGQEVVIQAFNFLSMQHVPAGQIAPFVGDLKNINAQSTIQAGAVNA